MPEFDAAAVRRAWQTAAEDLAIRVTGGATVDTGDSGSQAVVALVHDFGGQHGMAILAGYDPSVAEALRSSGYGFTVLSPSYERYDRDLFVDTLNDWQWSGSGAPPSWYSGRPWSE